MPMPRAVRRLVVLVLAFAVAPAAVAAPPTVQISVAPQTGLAPLDTTLVASGDAAAYRWEIGGVAAGEGPTLRHVFPAGRHQVTVVALSATGEEARQTVTVGAFSLSLTGPRVAAYASKTRFSGRISPALPGARVALQHAGRVVATGRVRRGGRFAIGARPRAPGPYSVRIGDLVSRAVPVAVRPRIAVDVGSSRVVGRPLVVRVALRPRAAGSLQVQVRRPEARPFVRTGRGRLVLRIRTRRAGAYRIRVSARPASGYASRTATVSVPFHVATLGPGSRGASVVELERRLAQLGYAVRGVDGRYGYDTYEAVLAFQKVHGLAWTGRVTAAVWRRLERAGPPRPRYARGNHVEVDKRRQVLFVVRRGRVVLVSHVSTGATGNTPVGRWRVYRKVAGWDSVLWYPLYFLRGFAIHGYPSVPAYPASHGCVRVPMWLAPRLHSRHPYGTVVYVY
jgi:putative peptidoglycan binding protein/L,D-transpeptidase-like protein